MRLIDYAIESAWALTYAAIGAILALALSPPDPPTPPLVGYGCDGTNGAIYAYDESNFPACLAIERVD